MHAQPTSRTVPDIATALSRAELIDLARAMPKAELHVHIEGTLEPELIFELAQRNGIALRYDSVEALRDAYAFTDLQSFLDVYYAGASVLIHERDFFEMAMAYYRRAADDNVVHAELFFDPQTHTQRGVAMETVVAGLSRARKTARLELGVTSSLILCFLRHLSEEDALDTLREATPFLDCIIGVGLDSGEVGNPPEKFERVFRRAAALGLRLVAHAGEEGPPAYITAALDILKVARIDHGVRCIEDPELMRRLAESRIPLTVCPLSNVKLQVYGDMEMHCIAQLLDAGLCVTVNSDDPAYFGGYVNANFEAIFEALPALDAKHAWQLAVNSFDASFVDDEEKDRWRERLSDVFERHRVAG